MGRGVSLGGQPTGRQLLDLCLGRVHGWMLGGFLGEALLLRLVKAVACDRLGDLRIDDVVVRSDLVAFRCRRQQLRTG